MFTIVIAIFAITTVIEITIFLIADHNATTTGRYPYNDRM